LKLKKRRFSPNAFVVIKTHPTQKRDKKINTVSIMKVKEKNIAVFTLLGCVWGNAQVLVIP